MKAVSIDIESTGLDPQTCQILEIGFVVFNTHKPFFQTKDNTLRIVFIREKLQGELYAINLNKNLISEILDVSKVLKAEDKSYDLYHTHNKTTLYVETSSISCCTQIVSSTIQEFLTKNDYDPRKDKITAAGKNFASFDKNFINKEYTLKNVKNSIHRKVLDVGPMYITDDDDEVPGLTTCLERAGYKNAVPHTAIEDAILVIKCIHAKTMPFFYYKDRSEVDGLNLIDTTNIPENLGVPTEIQPDLTVDKFKETKNIDLAEFFGSNAAQEAKNVLDRTAPTNFISPVQDTDFNIFTQDS